jgi:hypothetical protein
MLYWNEKLFFQKENDLLKKKSGKIKLKHPELRLKTEYFAFF